MVLNPLIPIAQAATGNSSNITDAAATGLDFLYAVAIMATALLAGWWLKQLVQTTIEKKFPNHTATSALYGWVGFSIIITLGGLLACQTAGVKVDPFIGCIGLAVGFLSSNVLGNFIAGIILLTQNIFNLGDWIEVGSAYGEIKNFGPRVTTIRARDGGDISIPNLEVLNSKIVCWTKNPVLRIEVPFRIARTEPIPRAIEIALAAINKIPNAEKNPAPEIIVMAISSYAVELEARVWVDSQGPYKKLVSLFTKTIFEDLRTAKINLPYPVHTLRIDHCSSEPLKQSCVAS